MENWRIESNLSNDIQILYWIFKVQKTQDNIIPEGDRNRLTTGCLENMEIFYIVNSIYKQITD